jgi:hypothetical protein
MHADPQNTVESCIAFCSASNFAYAGMEYGQVLSVCVVWKFFDIGLVRNVSAAIAFKTAGPLFLLLNAP